MPRSAVRRRFTPRRAALVVALAAGSASLSHCGGATTVGDFSFQPHGAGFTLNARDAGPALLTSYTGGTGAYAPLAVRTAKPEWQMEYGSFNIQDGLQDWTTASSFQLSHNRDGTIGGKWSDSHGTALATLTASNPAPGALLLTIAATDPTVNEVSLAFTCDAT